jgi:predicted kinase
MSRRVILLCGPPGAGKTTWAQQTGLKVYDRDDPEWNQGGEKAFRQAIARLATNLTAQAVVIRSGPTEHARQQTARLIGATETKVIATPLKTCEQRIKARRRLKQSIRTQAAAARSWWERYEKDSDVRPLSRWVL